MSFGIDVDILLSASDSSRPEHAKADAFLRRCVSEGQVYCVA